MSRTLILTVLSIATAASVAWAATVTVVQKGRAFSTEEITLRVGDQITFVNDDVYGHNVYSESNAGPFDIGLQKPGEDRTVTFNSAGTFDIRCRIHPKMRMTVQVDQ